MLINIFKELGQNVPYLFLSCLLIINDLIIKLIKHSEQREPNCKNMANLRKDSKLP